MGEFEQWAELDSKTLQRFVDVFIPRLDCFPRQIEDGSYISVKRALSISIVEAHLRGSITVGAYMLAPDNTTQKIVFDADDATEWGRLVALHSSLYSNGIPSYLEQSRRGGHLWLFFRDALSGTDARRFGKQLQREYGLESIELYPKQNELRTGPGSLVRLPFGIHRKDNRRYSFVSLEGFLLAPTVRKQLALLSNPNRVEPTFIQDILAHAPAEPIKSATLPYTKRLDIVGATPSEKIKNAISVRDFVSRYVQLDRGGRGLCPFHDDHQDSFAINDLGNYWHCFAGCGGGSVIDFWMRWNAIEFKQAVRELAAMLLSPLS